MCGGVGGEAGRGRKAPCVHSTILAIAPPGRCTPRSGGGLRGSGPAECLLGCSTAGQPVINLPSSLIPGFLPLITRRGSGRRPGLRAGLALSRLTGRRPGAPNCLAQSPTGSLEVMKSASPGPREAPAPLQEGHAGRTLQRKTPQQARGAEAWLGWVRGLHPMRQQGDVGLGLGLQDMALEKGLASPKAHH